VLVFFLPPNAQLSQLLKPQHKTRSCTYRKKFREPNRGCVKESIERCPINDGKLQKNADGQSADQPMILK